MTRSPTKRSGKSENSFDRRKRLASHVPTLPPVCTVHFGVRSLAAWRGGNANREFTRNRCDVEEGHVPCRRPDRLADHRGVRPCSVRRIAARRTHHGG